ncbi:MAG: hypothetical protein KHX03_03200 [Clostridium sp.]|nr:hypothetical protein [Clostridium sp.]
MQTEDLKLTFQKVMDELESPNGGFLDIDLENPEFKLELKYSRAEFIQDINSATLKFSDSQRMNYTGLFGFVLEKNEERLTLKGYPSVENIQEETSFPLSKIYYCVNLFTRENEIKIKNYPELAKIMNKIVKVFPEFLTAIGKIQHHTHNYTVDVHTLKVLQGVMSNEKYKTLPLEDKRALQTAVLMHDITKKEGEIDKSHPVCSAKDTSFILNRFNIDENERKKICLLIRNHDWLERYNKNITSALELSKELKDGNNFLMLCILAEADLKAVQRGGVFYFKYSDVLNKGAQEISALIEINNKLNVA